MKAVIRLEMIGDDTNYLRARYGVRFEIFRRLSRAMTGDSNKARPWVARLTGTDPVYGFQRQFVHPALDYLRANSVGSRGIYGYYPLDAGIYEVQERLSWGSTRRYFILVTPPDYHEITREEALAWVTNAPLV